MFKGLGDLGGLLKQAMDVKQRVDAFKDQLSSEQVEASAGGGMVSVVITGTFEVVSLKIDPELINKDEPEMLETLVRAAFNEATRKVSELIQNKMSEVTGGLDLPGFTG